MPTQSYHAVDKGWPKYGLLEYRVGLAWQAKVGAAPARPDNTIISLDYGLSAIIGELINDVSSIIQYCLIIY